MHPHAHEPNPAPPSPRSDFSLLLPDGSQHMITPEHLSGLPGMTVENCFIVSTGHGTSGPFAFTGPRLLDLVQAFWPAGWSGVEVISGDGFGAWVDRAELTDPALAQPILLALGRNGLPLSRADGLVRLIVPGERDDALRQVKWVGQILVKP